MAKKDTIKALVNRNFTEDEANILVKTYSTCGEVDCATVEDLVEAGITEERAKEIRAAAPAKKRSSRAPAKKAEVPVEAKDAEEEEVPVMEEVFKCSEVAEDVKPVYEAILAEAAKYERPIPGKLAKEIAEKIVSLSTTESPVSDEQIPKLVEVAERMYTAHLMVQNESAGVMAAHSIGEPGTQMNMRTFHNAGVANVTVTQGLPRLIEIVDARRVPSTPSMNIPLAGLAATDEGVAKHVASEIEVTYLPDIAEIDTDLDDLKLVVRLDPHKLDDRNLDISDIQEKISKTKKLKDHVIRGEGSYEIIIDASDSGSYKTLQEYFEAVKATKVKGIDGIKRAILSWDKDKHIWSIVTEGSNLKQVLKVPGVDQYNVTTNSILEIADVLGVEAARNSIIREAMGTMGEASLDVDPRHIMLVADLMTNDGTVRAIGRHGVSGKKSSVLARAAFEITVENLLHAAMIGESDNLEGVTENIIVGQPVTLGTGSVNLVYTPKKRETE